MDSIEGLEGVPELGITQKVTLKGELKFFEVTLPVIVPLYFTTIKNCR